MSELLPYYFDHVGLGGNPPPALISNIVTLNAYGHKTPDHLRPSPFARLKQLPFVGFERSEPEQGPVRIPPKRDKQKTHKETHIQLDRLIGRKMLNGTSVPG